MAKIFLKGVREPIEVSNERATALKEDWLADSLPDTIDLGGLITEKTALKSIELDEERDAGVDERRKMMFEAQKEKEEFLAQSSKKKTIFWFKWIFMTKYLLRVGYGNILGKGWSDEAGSYEERWPGYYEKFKKHLGKKKATQLYRLVSRWYEEDEENSQMFPPSELYSKWLPPRRQKKSISGWTSIGEALEGKIV
jgi:hypothetical protein